MENENDLQVQNANHSVASAEESSMESMASLEAPQYSIASGVPPNGDERSLVNRLEQQFSTNLKDVRFVRNSERAEEMGVESFAEGNTIHFSKGKLDASSEKGKEIIAHEVVHVIQSRNGRIKADDAMGETEVTTDPDIENEAKEESQKALKGESPAPKLVGSSTSNSSSSPAAAFGGFLKSLKKKASGAFSSVKKGVKGVVKKGVAGVKKVGSSIVRGGRKAIAKVKSVKNKVVNGVKALGKQIVKGGKKAFSTVKNKGKQLFNKAKSLYKSHVAPVLQHAKNVGKNVLNDAFQIGGGVLNGVKQMMSGDFKKGLGSMKNAVLGGIISGLDNLVSGTAGFFDKVLGPKGEKVSAEQLPDRTVSDEYLAHRVGYLKAEDIEKGDIAPEDEKILNNMGYDASSMKVRTGPNGFQAVLIYPDAFSENEASRPMLILRGTADLGGAVTDIDPYQVGDNQYNNNVKKIKELLELAEGKVDITGHSLGGAMAQIISAHHTDRIGRITTFQSPGVNDDTVRLYNNNLQGIPENERPEVNHHIVKRDLVSRAGDANLSGNYYEHDLNVNNALESHISYVSSREGFRQERERYGMTDSYYADELGTKTRGGGNIKSYNSQPYSYQRGMAESVRSAIGHIRDTPRNMFQMYEDYNTVIPQNTQSVNMPQTQEEKDLAKFNSYPEVKPSSGWLMSKDGVQQTTATNLAELGTASLANFEIVNLEGPIQEKIKTDPAMLAKEKEILRYVKNNPNYGKKKFYYTDVSVIGFGGTRWNSSNEDWGSIGNDNPLAHKETWDVASNELTWALRNATVKYWVEVDEKGKISVTYHLNDTLDLSGQNGRSGAYNNISNTLGFFYHKLGNGNVNLQTRSEWTKEY